MKHCNTDHYWPQAPGYTTARARQTFVIAVRDAALTHHLGKLGLAGSWLPYDGEFSTVYKGHFFGRGLPDLVVVTRCKRGHLHTVMHLSTEPYPRP